MISNDLFQHSYCKLFPVLIKCGISGFTQFQQFESSLRLTRSFLIVQVNFPWQELINQLSCIGKCCKPVTSRRSIYETSLVSKVSHLVGFDLAVAFRREEVLPVEAIS